MAGFLRPLGLVMALATSAVAMGANGTSTDTAVSEALAAYTNATNASSKADAAQSMASAMFNRSDALLSRVEELLNESNTSNSSDDAFAKANAAFEDASEAAWNASTVSWNAQQALMASHAVSAAQPGSQASLAPALRGAAPAVAGNVTATTARAAGSDVMLESSYGTCGCCCHNGGDKISNFWATCAAPENRCCHSCGIWNAQQSHWGSRGAQIMWGYMVVPSVPVSGMESITRSTAGQFDFLWNVAAAQVGHSSAYALIANPSMSRTQHQLHIHFRRMTSPGQSLRRKLEASLGCSAGVWQNAHVHMGGCRYSKARVFSSMPGVFSSVYSLATTRALGNLRSNPEGDLTLGTVGISVLFVCGGKPLVLATSSGGGYCSIEHSISNR